MALALVAAASGASDEGLQAGLLYACQTGPDSDYRIYGVPGSSPRYAEIVVAYSDGGSVLLGTSARDGSFAFDISHARSANGARLSIRDTRNPTEPTALALDYPRQGGLMWPPNERGFVNLVPADSDVEAGRAKWLEAYEMIREARGGVVNMERLSSESLGDMSAGTDVIVYGYAPIGESATCIIGPSGYSITGPIVDGMFELRLPHDQLRVPGHHQWVSPAVIVNVTSATNQILSFTGYNPRLPSWVKGEHEDPAR
jgi:hypothetical protein